MESVYAVISGEKYTDIQFEELWGIDILKSLWLWVLTCSFSVLNYTLYKNAGFWLVNSVIFVLQIQALHCEFAEFLLHVGVFA